MLLLACGSSDATQEKQRDTSATETEEAQHVDACDQSGVFCLSGWAETLLADADGIRVVDARSGETVELGWDRTGVSVVAVASGIARRVVVLSVYVRWEDGDFFYYNDRLEFGKIRPALKAAAFIEANSNFHNSRTPAAPVSASS